MSSTRSGVPWPDAKVRAGARVALEFLVKDRSKPYKVTEFAIVRKTGTRKPIEVPSEVGPILVRILSELAKGNDVTVLPVNAELTTQQTARFLNVSRPHVVALLESGKLPFRKVGTHRRVRLADLTRFREVEEARQKAALDELTAEAQKLGLGY